MILEPSFPARANPRDAVSADPRAVDPTGLN